MAYHAKRWPFMHSMLTITSGIIYHKLGLFAAFLFVLVIIVDVDVVVRRAHINPLLLTNVVFSFLE